jgi:ATP-dependent DNA ligase
LKVAVDQMISTHIFSQFTAGISAAERRYQLIKSHSAVDRSLDARCVRFDGDQLLFAAKVRNGFVPQVRREVAARFKGLEIDICRFANLPEKRRMQWALTEEEMKNCVWLKPELVAQIEFTEWTPDRHLRHAKFVGLREDKEAREVVREG